MRGSGYSRSGVIVGMAASMLVIGSAYMVLTLLKKDVNDASIQRLKTVVNVAHVRLNDWLVLNQEIIKYQIGTVPVRDAAAVLYKSPMALVRVKDRLGEWFKKLDNKWRYEELYLISKDFSSYMSLNDTKHVISETPLPFDFSIKMLAGEMFVMLLPAFNSRVSGKHTSNIRYPSGFVVITPLLHQEKVVAAMGFYLDTWHFFKQFNAAVYAPEGISVALLDKHAHQVMTSRDLDARLQPSQDVLVRLMKTLTQQSIARNQIAVMQSGLSRDLHAGLLWDQTYDVGLIAYESNRGDSVLFRHAVWMIGLIAGVIILLIWLVLLRHKFSQDNVRKTKHWLEMLLDTLPSAICILDKRGDVRYVNESMRRLKAAEFDYSCPDGRAYWPTIDLGSMWGEWTEKCRDEDGVDVIANFKHMEIRDKDNEPVTLIVANDITEYIAMQTEKELLSRQLQQAQKMEAIGQLTGGIAHDFNNMLSAIIGYTQLSLDYFSNDNEKLKSYLDEILNAGKRAQHLVMQMLTYSRSNDGESERLSPGPIIKDSLRLLKSTIPSSITLVENIPDVAPEITINPVQLQQVIMNLIINSRDAIEDKGIIFCKITQTYLEDGNCNSCHEKTVGHFLKIIVQDTGAGIEASRREKIFEPFFTTKEVGKGSGMGLSMVHGIIHSAGGHIFVSSQPGLGTEISLLLPITSTKVNNVAGKTA